jgi:pilus assembly protein CpaC
MKKKEVLCILTGIILLFFSSFSFAAITTEVILGKEAVITLKKPCIRVSVADPDVAGVTVVSPSEIVVTGKRAGITSLIVWDKEGNTFFDVKVIADVKEIQKEIKAIAPNDNIEVSFANDTIVLSGTASNRQTINKAIQIAEPYAVAYNTTTSTKYSAGVTTTETSSSGKVLNLVKIPDEQQVLLEVKVAQIDKTKLKQLGISYIAKGKNFELTAPGLVTSPTGNIGGAPGNKVTPGIGGFDLTTFVPQIGVAYFPGGVAAMLQALQTKGYSKILAEPNLVVRSGEKGEFMAGSEIPIQVVTGTGSNATVGIDYKKVGVMLNFAPEVLDTGAIRLKIDPAEVSSVTSFVSFQGVIAPQIDTRNVRTSVDLREGESLVLAGLLSDQVKKNMQKIPILGDLPIIGAFFRSTSDNITQTDLAFFITPRLVKPLQPGVKTELPTDKPMTPQEEKEFQWIPWPGTSGQYEGKSGAGEMK